MGTINTRQERTLPRGWTEKMWLSFKKNFLDAHHDEEEIKRKVENNIKYIEKVGLDEVNDQLELSMKGDQYVGGYEQAK